MNAKTAPISMPHGEARVVGTLTYRTTCLDGVTRVATIVTKTGEFTFNDSCVLSRAKRCRKWTYVCEMDDVLAFARYDAERTAGR